MIGESATLACLLVGALLAGLAAGVCWRSASRRPPLRLRWDGACWQLIKPAAEPEGLRAPVACIDLGAVLMLRVPRSTNRVARYLPLERRDQPASWHALRVALAQPPGHRGAARGSSVVGGDA